MKQTRSAVANETRKLADPAVYCPIRVIRVLFRRLEATQEPLCQDDKPQRIRRLTLDIPSPLGAAVIKKIGTKDLEVGMFIVDLGVPWLDHPFLQNQKSIRSAQEIRGILDHGIDEVWIDTARGKDSCRVRCLEETEEQRQRRMAICQTEIAKMRKILGMRASTHDQAVSEES